MFVRTFPSQSFTGLVCTFASLAGFTIVGYPGTNGSRLFHHFMVVVGKHFTSLLILVSWEIPTQLLKFDFLLPFNPQLLKFDFLLPFNQDLGTSHFQNLPKGPQVFSSLRNPPGNQVAASAPSQAALFCGRTPISVWMQTELQPTGGGGKAGASQVTGVFRLSDVMDVPDAQFVSIESLPGYHPA